MMKFLTIELEEEIKDSLNYIKQFEKGRGGLNLDFYDILNPEFDPEQYSDIIIDENFEVTIFPDDSEEYTITLREVIDLMNEVKTAKLIDNVKCISSKRGLVRVAPRLYEDIELLDILSYNNTKIFETESCIENIKFTCRIISGFSLFGILVHFSNAFDKYNPSINSDDMFIEVIPESTIDWKNLDIIIDAYIFELFATHGIKLSMNPRLDGSYEVIDDEDVLKKEYIFRPLLLGKGLSEVIKLFNSAEEGFNNLDYSIIQYTKVIEFVSQTVIRQEITNKALIKLMSSKALRPDANYIKELENFFVDSKQKYDTDKNAIKLTIRTCCDIQELVAHSPKYLDKLSRLQINLAKDKSDKDKVLEAAYDQLAEAVSDTRNVISHAKSNYTLKGNECPENQKDEFVIMIRLLAIQIIRWFSFVDEASRIVAE